MIIYFARHGDTDANEDSIPDKNTGEVDEPLNAQGVQQANGLAKQLKDIHFDAIISSSLKRAYHVSLETWNDLFDFDKNIIPEKGESLRDFFERVYGAIDTTKRQYEDKTILIVSHSGVNFALYAYVNKLTLEGNIRTRPLSNCEYRIYELNS
jgi:broad specificity phosphatase PhoE